MEHIINSLKISIMAIFLSSIFVSCSTRESNHLMVKEPWSDGMVLQQNSSTLICGRSKPSSNVYIITSWDKKRYRTAADESGVWRLHIDTPSASYAKRNIIVKSKGEILCIKNILVGEVWIAGGQSNMEMPLAGYFDSPVEGYEELLTLPNMEDKVRMFTVGVTESFEPLYDVAKTEGWKGACSQTLPQMSAVAFFFAYTLSEKLDIPIGIISLARGGSIVESWLPKEILQEYDYEPLDEKSILESSEWGRPYVLYNGMQRCVAGYAARGFIWYQGCSNVRKSDGYADKLTRMVSLWRNDWGDKDESMPFYQVEILPYQYGNSDRGTIVRDAQHLAAKQIPNGGIVVTDDLAYPHERTNVHPSNKRPIGRRLAYLALNRDYGFNTINCYSPEATDAWAEGDMVFVKLTNAWNGLDRWEGIKGLEISGADGIFYPVSEALYDWDHILKIKSEKVKKPVEVRYCYRDFAPGNLHNTVGLPVAPFRFVFE